MGVEIDGNRVAVDLQNIESRQSFMKFITLQIALIDADEFFQTRLIFGVSAAAVDDPGEERVVIIHFDFGQFDRLRGGGHAEGDQLGDGAFGEFPEACRGLVGVGGKDDRVVLEQHVDHISAAGQKPAGVF